MSRFSRFAPQQSSSASASRKPSRERDYFDEDDEPDATVTVQSFRNDEEEDPLDAFMSNIKEQVAKEKTQTGSKPTQSLPQILSYGDDEAGIAEDEVDDMIDSEANLNYIDSDEDNEDTKAESTKNPRGKLIEPLPRVDHTQIKYPLFRKHFYKEVPELQNLTLEEVNRIRKDLEISVTTSSTQTIPKPVLSFSQCSFPAPLLSEIERQGYQKPTPIQAQCLPILLSGQDLLGLAKTGSGKTLAYVWPMLIHILDQPQMQIGDGPIALVLVPTRELANQIYTEIKKYAKLFQIRLVAIYGGAGKYEMSKTLKESPEVVVATPGRFIEMIKLKATNLQRVSYVVLDEADRMFEMGFEYQIRSILCNIQPKKQLAMFSATMKKRIEAFAREMFSNQNEIRVVIGMIGQANTDIQQIAKVMPNDTEKWLWLASEIDDFAANGKVLIFVLSKAETEELTLKLKDFFSKRQLDITVDCIHGDKDQYDRSRIMNRFIKKPTSSTSGEPELTILVATDIAARGLDVQDIRTVINYDVAKNIETYVHRIGRTGRMGVAGVAPGTAYTLLTPKDSSFAVDLVQNLRLSAQPVSEELLQLAMTDQKWYKIRHFSSQSEGNRHSITMKSGFATKAMTSAMIANETSLAMNITLPSGIAQAFQQQQQQQQQQREGMDNGLKRKSKFSSEPPSSVATSSSFSTTTQPRPSTVLPGFVRSENSSNTTTSSSIQASNRLVSQSNNPLMHGFVKSSTSYASVSSSSMTTHNPTGTDQPRKKSRWG